MNDAVVTINAPYLSLLLGVVLPLLVGLVTKRITASGVQRALLLALSIVGGALVQIAQAGGSFRLGETLVNIAVAYFTAQTSYSAVLKPTGVADAFSRATDGIGVTIVADPAKVAALEGAVTTADAAVAVGEGDTPVVEADPPVEVGDTAIVVQEDDAVLPFVTTERALAKAPSKAPAKKVAAARKAPAKKTPAKKVTPRKST